MANLGGGGVGVGHEPVHDPASVTYRLRSPSSVHGDQSPVGAAANKFSVNLSLNKFKYEPKLHKIMYPSGGTPVLAAAPLNWSSFGAEGNCFLRSQP